MFYAMDRKTVKAIADIIGENGLQHVQGMFYGVGEPLEDRRVGMTDVQWHPSLGAILHDPVHSHNYPVVSACATGAAYIYAIREKLQYPAQFARDLSQTFEDVYGVSLTAANDYLHPEHLGVLREAISTLPHPLPEFMPLAQQVKETIKEIQQRNSDDYKAAS